MDKAITIGEIVYVHVAGVADNEKLDSVHKVNLERCSITDQNGQNEILLIKGTYRTFQQTRAYFYFSDNQAIHNQTHVETINTPGAIGPDLNEAAVFAFQGESINRNSDSSTLLLFQYLSTKVARINSNLTVMLTLSFEMK